MPANSALMAGTTPYATTLVLHLDRPAPASHHTQNARNPLPEFCEGLSVDNTIIVRVSNEERADNLDEEYLVANIEEEATLLEEDETYSAVPYQENDWIVFVC